MRRIACRTALLALAAVPALLLVTVPVMPARAQQGPPHAFLFGSWTGGLFPVATDLTAQACLSHPTVIFTQDLVLRATLTDISLVQRQVETARGNGVGVEFRFVETAPAGDQGVFNVVAPPPTPGFGCESPDVLHVQRISDHEISFPGCADFPSPLLRCPSR